MNLQRAHEALIQLFSAGSFQYANDLATVAYDDYKDIIESLEPPSNYSIGYDLAGINWLENCFIDKDEHNITELIRRERSWQYGSVRAFQLEIITVPRLILVTTEPNEPSILQTTWYVDDKGETVAYIQTFNNNILEDIRE